LKFIESSQQWDYSNVWAPNQEEIILMLLKYDKEMSLKFARKFFNTVYAGWLKDGMIFEKYSALEFGKRGKGGEYEVQKGFGWTNGVCIVLLNLFKDDLLKI
jgi:alpha,alpha-trehalase